MLDPMTALSLAGNVIQFVDFGIEVLSATGSLYGSVGGALDFNEELELVTTDLAAVCQLMGGRSATTSERALRDLCKGCNDVANELLTQLNKLKVSPDAPDPPDGKKPILSRFQKEKKVLRSFHQAIRSIWKEEEIEKLVKRLSSFRDEIQMRIVLGFRYL
jgi:hypothetical protein